jgi:hypothetical protein
MHDDKINERAFKLFIVLILDNNMQRRLQYFAVVSGQINPDWDFVQANQMSTSSKTNNLICLFETLDDI